MPRQPAGLISVLRDPTARPDEQHDAAMDLAAFDDPDAEAALLQRASELAYVTAGDPYDLVAEACGESLAEIWCRQEQLPAGALRCLEGPALYGARAVLQARRPVLLVQ